MSERFSRLCQEDAVMYQNDGDGIGTYNEKRFHRIFKRLVTEDASCYEAKIGKYVADVFCDGHITEIQTANYGKLAPKIRYYLEETDYTVSVVLPLVSSKKIIRADKETGEVQYARRSPKSARETDAFKHLYYLRELIPNERLRVHIALVSVEEYRFSDKQRYRREGKYDNDVRPIALEKEVVLKGTDDYRRFVPEELKNEEFDAKLFSSLTKLRGRALYSTLNTLHALGILSRRENGKRYVYKVSL